MWVHTYSTPASVFFKFFVTFTLLSSFLPVIWKTYTHRRKTHLPRCCCWNVLKMNQPESDYLLRKHLTPPPCYVADTHTHTHTYIYIEHSLHLLCPLLPHFYDHLWARFWAQGGPDTWICETARCQRCWKPEALKQEHLLCLRLNIKNTQEDHIQHTSVIYRIYLHFVFTDFASLHIFKDEEPLLLSPILALLDFLFSTLRQKYMI